ncbi:unnamed protein product [Adineta ricciae]|uniref:Uncharacterized protein n=1 Tax=Adineta ricciae TaxID=249248 RepID=A0A814NCG1_ADIRI|nr:unnamed protein product [Adineta ricciae]
MHQISYVVLLSTLVIGSTVSLQCYYCNYRFSNCNDPFETTRHNAKTISSSDNWCWKYKQEINHIQLVTRNDPTAVSALTPVCTKNGCHLECFYFPKSLLYELY